jgi:hypothetical protein
MGNTDRKEKTLRITIISVSVRALLGTPTIDIILTFTNKSFTHAKL